MTLDAIIASDAVSGSLLAYRVIAAEYIVDGQRFGGLELRTRANSDALVKEHSELLNVSLMLAALGYRNVRLRATDESGRPLDRPDLDFEHDGKVIGLEFAFVGSQDEFEHESILLSLNEYFFELLHSNAEFRNKFGNFDINLSLNGLGRPQALLAGHDRNLLRNEIKQFFETGKHLAATDVQPFLIPINYPVLAGRGAWLMRYPMLHQPQLTIGEGPHAFASSNASGMVDLERVVNDHASSATTYRRVDNWLFLFLPAAHELFSATLQSAVDGQLKFSPFKRLVMADSSWRVIDLPLRSE